MSVTFSSVFSIVFAFKLCSSALSLLLNFVQKQMVEVLKHSTEPLLHPSDILV